MLLLWLYRKLGSFHIIKNTSHNYMCVLDNIRLREPSKYIVYHTLIRFDDESLIFDKTCRFSKPSTRLTFSHSYPISICVAHCPCLLHMLRKVLFPPMSWLDWIATFSQLRITNTMWLKSCRRYHGYVRSIASDSTGLNYLLWQLE